jgi:hypothetical protein
MGASREFGTTTGRDLHVIKSREELYGISSFTGLFLSVKLEASKRPLISFGLS